MFNKVRHLRLEPGRHALPWQHKRRVAQMFGLFHFQLLQEQRARSDTWNVTVVLRTWPTSPLAVSPPVLSNCKGPAGAGVSRDVSVQSFAWVSQSKWQDLFYHTEPSPVSKAAGWNFLLWRPPLCGCVAKGFCRLLYCLNSHQICTIIQAWKRKQNRTKQKHKANFKTKIFPQRPHQELLTSTCLKMFWDVLLLSIWKIAGLSCFALTFINAKHLLTLAQVLILGHLVENVLELRKSRGVFCISVDMLKMQNCISFQPSVKMRLLRNFEPCFSLLSERFHFGAF